ncbi:MAG TPA: magnesium chelatase ATPase subunit I [Pyrinomonadaceae bacterium]|nr:magnesium chelatase ATPase subunit I [Pyrinomonadaceae bacterium]
MTGRSAKNRDTDTRTSPPPVFPFTALTGQEEMKLALLLNAVSPAVGGVLVSGHRGTGKSTAVRALAELLPPVARVRGCPFNCDPSDTQNLCDDCRARHERGERLPRERAPVAVVELPLNATEDRVCGTLDIERALKEGVRGFEPGLLARANRSFLYVDEVNLLDDHLVDLLLDVAASGRNRVEREGVSREHPARFVLVGSGNPEEGELRPQLLDRFGLCAEVRTVLDVDERVRIVELRESFERDPAAFLAAQESEQAALRRRIVRARTLVAGVEMPRAVLRLIAELCVRLRVDGHRGEITLARAARALAALEGRRRVTHEDVRRVAPLALRHRLRRDPLEQQTGGARLDEAVAQLFNNTDGAPLSKRSDDATESRPPVNHSSTRDNDGQDAARGTNPHGQQQHAPPADGRLPEGALDSTSDTARRPARNTPHGRGRTRTTTDAPRGRYARATEQRTACGRVAVDATLRVASARRHERRGAPFADTCAESAHALSAFGVSAEDLRFKLLRRRQGTLYVLAVDTSGSMAVNRIGQAKGALAHLLRESYVRRDRVALVSFRERDAQTLLAPSTSAARARRILDALPVGGATPLPAALARVLEIARRARDAGAQRIVHVLFTDGRANVPLTEVAHEDGAARRRRIASEVEHLGAALRVAGVRSVVVDTQQRFITGGEGLSLSRSLGGRYLQLSTGAPAALSGEILQQD